MIDVMKNQVGFKGTIRPMSFKRCSLLTDETILQAGVQTEQGKMRLFFGEQTQNFDYLESQVTSLMSDERPLEGRVIEFSGYTHGDDPRGAVFVESYVIH